MDARRLLGTLVALAVAGSSCKASPEECSVEGSESCMGREQAIACRDHRLVTLSCRGPGGCVTAGGPKHCDESLGVAGEVCNSPGHATCSIDHVTTLACQEGVWSPVHRCRGKKGCYTENRNVRCDTAGVIDGDPCVAEGAGECSVDGRALLVCKNGKFVAGGVCADGKVCKEGGGLAGCE